MTSWAQDAITFGQADHGMGKVAHTKHHGDHIKTLLGMWQAMRIPDAELHAVRRCSSGQTLPAYVQHGLGEIDPNQTCARGAAPGYLRHDAPGATGDIQDHLGSVTCHALPQAPAPDTIQTGANDRVRQVVTLRNATKHAAQPLWSHTSEHAIPAHSLLYHGDEED